jgi:hypothetical protein
MKPEREKKGLKEARKGENRTESSQKGRGQD